MGWGSDEMGLKNPPLGLTNVIAIAAGGSNSLALKADGSVVVWGFNQFGPVYRPPGLTNVVALTGGAQHSMALWGDGSIAFTTQPRDLMLTVESPASFRAGVFGVPPLAYQWQHEGTNLPGATSSVLFISKVQEQDEGSYQLLVTSSMGSAVSSNAFLSVFSLTVPGRLLRHLWFCPSNAH